MTKTTKVSAHTRCLPEKAPDPFAPAIEAKRRRAKRNALPDTNILYDLLDYNPLTGALTRKVATYANPEGSLATCPSNGALVVLVNRRLYQAHRVIWKMMTGKDPKVLIDHKNLDRSDNRWANLREATCQQNCVNKTPFAKLGVKGVKRAHSIKERYTAQITVNRRAIHLGTFPTVEEAGEAYRVAAVKHFGEFARWERSSA